MTDDPTRPATVKDVHEALVAVAASTGGMALYQGMSIVAALAEARVLDPMTVVKWATFFATNLPEGLAADQREAIKHGIESFATVLRSMATKPPGAGSA